MDIERRVERVEAIVERLESGDVSLAEARDLYEEGREHLDALEAALDVEDGSVIELAR